MNGQAVLFDINKTVGTRDPPTDSGKALAATLAKGIDSIVDDQGSVRPF